MSIQELVDNAIETNKVTIFSKSFCGYCRKTQAVFTKYFPDVEAKVFELNKMDDGTGAAIQEYLYEKTGQSTVPNVFVAGQHIGGSDKVQASYHSGKLKELIEA